ncbi:RNA lariat debranching enzyme Dbr1 [Schizosaccharomyces pombe]|uniref:Lariat debranching enzyme n=1 Tax=Schizosaccharomyces pombe (strain 972 / ATCC 24843) TaxID=284812 RepID=DBR1_SCHPO
MRVGVQGCCHGILDNLYILAEKRKVDLLIIGGDFQALRNVSDYHGISMPPKFKRLGDFFNYYNGRNKAPILTIFVGGNHEASNYLDELPYGGWVAPNIYYMGRSSVINVGGLRIAGISGIYSAMDYKKGRYEGLPYNYKMLKSIYHTREFDVLSLKSLQKPIDIFLSHDWPRGIEQHGDVAKLLRHKPFFRNEVERNDLGSPALEELLVELKPRYWMAAHLHTKFTAVVHHNSQEDDGKLSCSSKDVTSSGFSMKGLNEPSQERLPVEKEQNDKSDEEGSNNEQEEKQDKKQSTNRDLCRKESCKKEPSLSSSDQVTKFLALDKCLPRRSYFEVVEIEPVEIPDSGAPYMQYDSEWLSVLRAMHPFQSHTIEQDPPLPSLEVVKTLKRKEEIWVDENLVKKDKLGIPRNFCQTAPPHSRDITENMQPSSYINPQTVAFEILIGLKERTVDSPPPVKNPNEIVL